MGENCSWLQALHRNQGNVTKVKIQAGGTLPGMDHTMVEDKDYNKFYALAVQEAQKLGGNIVIQ